MHSMIASLFGPIFAKEMVEVARRKRYFFNRAAFGAVLLIAIFVVWKEYERRFSNPMFGSTVQVMADFAATQFAVVSWIQYLAVYVFVPLFLCGVIASEREERSLDLLFTTDLTNREIILGKLMSRVFSLVFLIVTALPVVSIMMLFGGIDPAAIWRTLAATFLAILYVSAHAIYFSATTKSTVGALVRTYWWMALWLFGLPLLVLLLAHAAKNVKIRDDSLIAICSINPIAPFYLAQDTVSYDQVGSAVVNALSSYLVPGTAAMLGRWCFTALFFFPVLISLALIRGAVRRLRHEPRTAFASLRSWRVWWILGRRKTPTPHAQAVRQRARGERTWYGMPVRNPLWWRSRRARVYDREGHVGRIQWLAWGLAACFFVLFAALVPNDLEEDSTTISFLAPTYGVFAAMAIIFAASSFVGDRRRGMLELLLVTTLTPRAIIDGTLLAIWQHLRRLYFLILVLAVVFACVSNTHTYGMVFSVMTATLFCMLLIMHGMACSLVARTHAAALVMTFIFPLLFIIGMPFEMMAFEGAHGPVLWIVSPFLLVVAWVAVTILRPNAFTVGSFFMTVHLCLMSYAMAWTYHGQPRDAHPMQDFHSAFLALVALDRHFPEYEFRDVTWFVVYFVYWIGLIANVLWARWWLIRNFDRLAGRIRDQGKKEKMVRTIHVPRVQTTPVNV